MPIYEYRCSTCGFQKEFLRKVSDPLLSVCPECGKETFGKMLTAAGFQLKGGGWYATDFKHSGAKPGAKTAGEGASASGSKSSGESDSKSESKSESKSDSKSKSESKTPSQPAAAAASTATASTAKSE